MKEKKRDDNKLCGNVTRIAREKAHGPNKKTLLLLLLLLFRLFYSLFLRLFAVPYDQSFNPSAYSLANNDYFKAEIDESTCRDIK